MNEWEKELRAHIHGQELAAKLGEEMRAARHVGIATVAATGSVPRLVAIAERVPRDQNGVTLPFGFFVEKI